MFIGEISRLATVHASLLKGLALGSLCFFILTPILAPAVIVLMPADALVRNRRHFADRPPLRRAGYLVWHILKNLLGITLMLLGVLLLFMPGQGLLTIFAGTLLTDLPGKRRLSGRLLGSGRIRPVVDRLRQKYGKAPLIFPL